MKASREEAEGELHAQIRQLKQENSKKREAESKQKDNYEEKLQEVSRTSKREKSEFEKEKALLEQKVEFLEK